MIDWLYLLRIVEIVLAGGVLTALLMHWREYPKARAAAKKLSEETEGAEWGRFQREIGRLEGRLTKVEAENDALRERLDRQRGERTTLEHENEALRHDIKHLETRLAALENLFRTIPLTAEMQAQLDSLDQLAPRKRKAK